MRGTGLPLTKFQFQVLSPRSNYKAQKSPSLSLKHSGKFVHYWCVVYDISMRLLSDSSMLLSNLSFWFMNVENFFLRPALPDNFRVSWKSDIGREIQKWNSETMHSNLMIRFCHNRSKWVTCGKTVEGIIVYVDRQNDQPGNGFWLSSNQHKFI